MRQRGDAQAANPFLPVTREEMDERGWDALDVLLVTGDAYVDHPAFGAALLGRWLESRGLRVGVVAQPRWEGVEDLAALGLPRRFVGVTAGALDSMLAHYTAFRKKRRDDAYTPGGRAGARPNRATIVYTNLARQAFPGVPVIVGGVEASMRRAAHYDFWQDKVRRSVLLDSKADLLVYGMAERALLEVAERLRSQTRGRDAPPTPLAREALRGIRGTVFVGDEGDVPEGAETAWLPSYEAIAREPAKLMEATLAIERQVHHGSPWLLQAAGNQSIVIAPPPEPLTTAELDALYALPSTRRPHPSYREPIPAVEMIQFSVTTHRGCAGGCSFCSLALHQGRRIRSRSAESVVTEVRRLSEHPDWQGSLSDLGGPTANMWGAECTGDPATCRRSSCLTPAVCGHFQPDQKRLAELLDRIDQLPGVKHLRVASGVRHDLALREPDYVRTLIRAFVGGQLKLAPEHRCEPVLRLMRKPSFEAFERFLTVFERESAAAGKEQYVIPYLMSAFPGCTEHHMIELARWLKARGWRPQQVQCFVPTPGTVATAMFYAGTDPEGNRIPVARTDAERLRQHRILMPQRRRRPRRRR
ncbi:MAG: YgiQ family radical SAM protein [bacterium]